MGRTPPGGLMRDSLGTIWKDGGSSKDCNLEPMRSAGKSVALVIYVKG